MSKMIVDRLYQSVAEKGPICVGLDTDISYVPQWLRDECENDGEAVLAFNKQIIDGFTALIDKNAELYLSDAKENLAKEVDNAGFYLTKDGVVVYFQLYTLQAYAAGFSTCTLPLPAAK